MKCKILIGLVATKATCYTWNPVTTSPEPAPYKMAGHMSSQLFHWWQKMLPPFESTEMKPKSSLHLLRMWHACYYRRQAFFIQGMAGHYTAARAATIQLLQHYSRHKHFSCDQKGTGGVRVHTEHTAGYMSNMASLGVCVCHFSHSALPLLKMASQTRPQAPRVQCSSVTTTATVVAFWFQL
jgi:hypothetical protein